MSFEQTPAQKTNGFAIAAMVNGIVGITFFWTVVLGVCSILGIIFGHLSLTQMKTTPSQGRGMAIAGLVLGYVALGFWFLVFLVAAIAAVN